MDENRCDPQDISLKSFFLGPQSENADWVTQEVVEIFKHWSGWRRSLFTEDGPAISDQDIQEPEFQHKKNQMIAHLKVLITMLEAEIPQFSPRYIGHMTSETSLPAILGHLATLLHNPNNISGEVSRVGARVEKEAIEFLQQMVGYNPAEAKGHFTSGGTIANFESLWRARYTMDHWIALGAYLRDNNHSDQPLFNLAHQGWESFQEWTDRLNIKDKDLKDYSVVANNPWKVAKVYDKVFDLEYQGAVALVPGNKHYSWQKGISLLGFGGEAFWSVDLDENGQLSVEDLKRKIERARSEQRPILMVVSVAGTTELGELDPVDRVQDLLDNYKEEENLHIWHHVDAAYGGFYCSLLRGEQEENLSLPKEQLSALAGIARADSVTLDPHKLGYVPYACGAILVRDKRHYEVSSFVAPYLPSKPEWSQWLRTLEGSRTATGAAATWLTAKSVGLDRKGYGRILELCIDARKNLESLLYDNVKGCFVAPNSHTNILCFCVAQKGQALSDISLTSQTIYKETAKQGFYLSMTQLSLKEYGDYLQDFMDKWQPKIDQEYISFVRIVIMNPFLLPKKLGSITLTLCWK